MAMFKTKSSHGLLNVHPKPWIIALGGENPVTLPLKPPKPPNING
jgi:hypothetical protein